MKLKLLAAAASVAFISTGVAFAQDNPARKDERPAQERAEPRAPAAAPRAAEPRKEMAPRAAQAEPRKEAAPRAAQAEPRKEMAPRHDQMKNGAADTREKMAAPKAADTREKMAAPKAADTEQKMAPKAADSDQKGANKTAEHQDRGAPRVQGKANISAEHAARIGEVLHGQSQPVRVNVNIRVGERIPETVVVRPLPTEVVELVPEYRGYDYFVDSDDEIVFVSPKSHEIVGMIDYGSDDAPVVAGARPCPVEN